MEKYIVNYAYNTVNIKEIEDKPMIAYRIKGNTLFKIVKIINPDIRNNILIKLYSVQAKITNNINWKPNNKG